MNDATCTEQDKFNLGYTLYHYLKHEYKIYHGFSVTKYFSEERDEIIKKLQQLDKNHLENWLTHLQFVGQTEFGSCEHDILERKKERKIDRKRNTLRLKKINKQLTIHYKNIDVMLQSILILNLQQ